MLLESCPKARKIKFSLLFLAFAACTSGQISSRDPAAANAQLYEKLRGNPSEYDPGAPKDSDWVRLYSSAPNYRQVGKALLGGTDEKFRWEFGPMWYRGRLAPNQVKVFIVGQEGAQDENISNRAFTGSTGTKTQNFLNSIGIYRSYLFMNTFVYTINGQLDGDPKFNFMEQGEGAPNQNVELSPIVAYRHQLFDNMIKTNKDQIALLMGVGAGGKNSLATWINARGGKCNVAKDMQMCDTTGMVAYFAKQGFVIKGPILVIGVPHPGGASAANGGAAALVNIKAGFTAAAQRVAAMKIKNQDWLPQDPDDPLNLTDRLAAMRNPFVYQDAGVPYRDFAYGTNWRMGHDGTTSNRWKSDSIQIFSDVGDYGDKSAKYNEQDLGMQTSINESGLDLSPNGFVKGTDMSWEPPKYIATNARRVSAYDPGPCEKYDNYSFSQNYAAPSCDLAEAMTLNWPAATGVNSPSFGPISVYRGRLTRAKILIIADQTSQDDIFSGRALTGLKGQQLQKWLESQNAGLDYAILRTTPWDTLGAANEAALKASAKAQLLKIGNLVIDKSKTVKIIGYGSWASQVAQELANSRKIPFQALNLPDSAPISAIPREDLPYHSRWWMGTTGNRAVRGVDGTVTKPEPGAQWHYYRVYAPKWNADPTLLPQLEPSYIQKLQTTIISLNPGLDQ